MKKLILYLIFAAIAVILLTIWLAMFVIPSKTTAPAVELPLTIEPSTDTIMIATDGVGEYLVDGRGMTLYYFTKDTVGKSNCADACLSLWPIFYDKNIVVTPPLQKSDFTTILGTNGSNQLTYKGYPLYYYSKDVVPGDITGEGVNDVWFVVKP